MDDVGSGSAKYLSQFSDLTSLLGSFSASDPVVGNRNMPWLFAGNMLANIKGSSSAALVLTDFGGWQPPPQLGGQQFRRLRCDVWVDAQRDALGNIDQTDEATIQAGSAILTVLHHHLHRRDPDTVTGGDMVTFGCQYLTWAPFSQMQDGDWAMMATAYYGVSISGWTDVIS